MTILVKRCGGHRTISVIVALRIICDDGLRPPHPRPLRSCLLPLSPLHCSHQADREGQRWRTCGSDSKPLREDAACGRNGCKRCPDSDPYFHPPFSFHSAAARLNIHTGQVSPQLPPLRSTSPLGGDVTTSASLTCFSCTSMTGRHDNLAVTFGVFFYDQKMLFGRI